MTDTCAELRIRGYDSVYECILTLGHPDAHRDYFGTMWERGYD